MVIAKVGTIIAVALSIPMSFYYGGVFSGTIPEPIWSGLDANNTTANTTYNGKYAAEYLKYLVVANKAEKKADAWWKWSFLNRYRSSSKGGFANLANWDKLKEACENAYLGTLDTTTHVVKGTVSTSKVGSSTVSTQADYSEDEIWRYCSTLQYKPRPIENGYPGRLGNDGEKTTWGKYISVRDSKNDKFWTVKQRELERPKTDDFFSALLRKGTTLKEACRAAYEIPKAGTTTVPGAVSPAAAVVPTAASSGPTSTTSSTPNANTGTAVAPSSTDILKYCSLKGS